MGRRAVTASAGPSLFAATRHAPTIAEQVHQVLVQREEERCVAIEQATGESETRRKIRVPVVRQGPNALCDKPDYVAMISEFDYDLNNAAFRVYCRLRGVLSVAGQPGSARRDFFREHWRTKADYLNEPQFLVAVAHEGVKLAYSPADLQSNWLVILYGRAVLQDAWQVFTGRRDLEPGPSAKMKRIKKHQADT